MADFKITDKNGIKLKTANKYVTEDLTVTLTDDDINNLAPENIKKDKVILGITGTFEGGITPSGKIEITNTEEINVSEYATAQIVDSNLVEGNIKNGVSILGVTGTYEGEIGGGTTIEDELVTGEISGDYSNDRVTKVGDYKFYYCSKLTSVNFPNVNSISSYAFFNCKNLTSVNIPNATSIGGSAFGGCSKLTNINFPNVTYIGDYTFNKCLSLISVILPNVTTIGSAFSGCESLTDISFPKVTRIGSNAFSFCYDLTNVSLPQAKSINANAFRSCYKLIKLVITQTDSVCTLSNTNAFQDCYHILGAKDNTYNPTGAKDGYIYVPDTLVGSYKTATNWSKYASQIKPLSTLKK